MNRAERKAGRILHTPDVVFGVMAAGNGWGHHHVTCPIIHSERFAWNRVVEQAIGSGAEDRPENKD
jgi:hypothetical protein